MKKLSKSIRKHIRQEKSRIRREILDFKEQEKKIKELYENLGGLAKKEIRDYNETNEEQRHFSQSNKRTNAIK